MRGFVSLVSPACDEPSWFCAGGGDQTPRQRSQICIALVVVLHPGCVHCRQGAVFHVTFRIKSFRRLCFLFTERCSVVFCIQQFLTRIPAILSEVFLIFLHPAVDICKRVQVIDFATVSHNKQYKFIRIFCVKELHVSITIFKPKVYVI